MLWGYPGTGSASGFAYRWLKSGFERLVREEASMASRETEEQDRMTDREIERYRQAALDALGQLDWCVDYLYKVRKAEIARVIARNRQKIIERARL
jgi:hypothetical protein